MCFSMGKNNIKLLIWPSECKSTLMTYSTTCFHNIIKKLTEQYILSSFNLGNLRRNQLYYQKRILVKSRKRIYKIINNKFRRRNQLFIIRTGEKRHVILENSQKLRYLCLLHKIANKL